jgi:hypothetical protein
MVSLPNGSIAFIVGNLSAAVASQALVECFFIGREPWRRWLAGCASFILLITFDLLVLGSLGLLRPAYVAGLMFVIAVLCVVMACFLRPWFALPDEVEAQVPLESKQHVPDLHLMRLLATAMFVLFVVGLILRFAFKSPEWFNDDFAYHATNVVQWILDERLSVGAMNNHAYWPLNSELVPLWLILPFRADGMAVWSGLPWLILAMAAMIGLARAQQLDWSIGVMTVALVAASPGIAWMLRTFSAADFAGAAMLMASIAFLAPTVRGQITSNRQEERHDSSPTTSASFSPTEAELRTRTVDIIFAGLAAGFAIGCKVPFVFPVTFLGLWIVFARQPSLSIGTRLKRAVLFAVAIIGTGIYWYARNWILTGNPLFPGKLGPFDGPLTLDNAQPTLFDWMRRPPVLSAWTGFVESYVGSWPLGLGLLALVAFAAAVGCWFRRERSVCSVQFILSVTFFILLASHPFMPLSGPYPLESPNPHFVPRYINSAFIVGMALAAPLLGVAGRSRSLWWTWAILSLMTAWPGPGKSVLVLTVLALGAVLVVDWLPGRWLIPAPSYRLAVSYATLVIATVGLAFYSTRSQRIVDRFMLQEYSSGPDTVGNGWRALEQLPAGSRIAWFDNYDWEYYPMYGRRWQFVPYRVNRDGTPFQPVHVNWRTLTEGPPDSPNVVRNLVEGQAQYIFVSKHRSDQWPPQYDVIARSGTVRKVYHDGYNAIFEILRRETVAP